MNRVNTSLKSSLAGSLLLNLELSGATGDSDQPPMPILDTLSIVYLSSGPMSANADSFSSEGSYPNLNFPELEIGKDNFEILPVFNLFAA